MRLVPLAASALALCTAIGTGAQKVYRCGPDGRTYQQTACAEGKAVDASDPRSAEQRQAAQAVAKSEAKKAEQFDRTLAPASAPKGGKVKAEPAAASKAASGAQAAPKKAEAETKPPVYLAPQPKGAASAAK